MPFSKNFTNYEDGKEIDKQSQYSVNWNSPQGFYAFHGIGALLAVGAEGVTNQKAIDGITVLRYSLVEKIKGVCRG